MKRATQGPAAFTGARARIEYRLPSLRSRCRCQSPLLRRALTQRVRGMDVGAVLAGGDRVEHHQARIVHRAVGVLEATADLGLQRAAAGEAQGRAGGQLLALAEVIVEEQAGADHQSRAQVRTVRQDEAQRLDDVRRLGQQDLALGQGFADQAEFVVFEWRRPPWINLLLAEEVCWARSCCSQRNTGQAAPGCVGGDPSPLMPPPTTATS